MTFEELDNELYCTTKGCLDDLESKDYQDEEKLKCLFRNLLIGDEESKKEYPEEDSSYILMIGRLFHDDCNTIYEVVSKDLNSSKPIKARTISEGKSEFMEFDMNEINLRFGYVGNYHHSYNKSTKEILANYFKETKALLSVETFQKSRKFMTKKKYEKINGKDILSDNCIGCFVYLDSNLYVEVTKNGKFWTICCNSDYYHSDIEEVERWFYNQYEDEIKSVFNA